MCFNVLAEMLLSYTLTLYIKTHDQKTSLTYAACTPLLLHLNHAWSLAECQTDHMYMPQVRLARSDNAHL